MSSVQTILDRLAEIESEQPGNNSYEVWAYVQSLPEWDESRQEEIDPNQFGNAIALKTGEVIRWDDARKVWYEA